MTAVEAPFSATRGGTLRFANYLKSNSVQENGGTGGSSSMTGISGSAADNNNEDVGDLHYNLSYDFHSRTLTVKIIEAKRLPAADFTGTSDPYVVLTLLPKKYKVQTKIKKRTCSPRWHETFLFEDFPLDKLKSMTLHFYVLDWDRFSKDDPLGELFVPLCDVDFSTRALDFWKSLRPVRNEQKNKCGEILLNLCYSEPTLSVEIVNCRNLRAKDIVVNSSDPYVKLWLSFSGKRMEKKKTKTYMRTLNPTFDEKFDFLVPYEKIREASIQISVMDWDKIGRNDLIGRIVLASRQSDPAAISHWNNMLQHPKQQVGQWHTLKE